jgi:hypothetical protein
MITPMLDLEPVQNGSNAPNGQSDIGFRIRRKNSTVSLQWQPFQGSMSQNGVAYLSVQQTINNMPSYVIDVPIIIKYKGENKQTFLRVDPFDSVKIKFYLDISGSGTDVAYGDNIMVPGSCVTWIADN